MQTHSLWMNFRNRDVLQRVILEETGKEDVVLKHVHGVASVGVHLVHGKKELSDAFRQEETAENMFGETENRLLLQERIFGEEYIVNTISRNGVPALTSVFRYYKKECRIHEKSIW